jgi:orotate phosphoribosyltransferase
MTEAEVLDTLERVGAFRAGHFVFISGRHGDKYINKDALFPFTKETSQLCRAMAERFKDDGIEVVIGPAVGAAILSQWVASHLSEMTGHNVSAVYADKNGDGGYIVKRGYDRVLDGKKTLVVEDLMTTGGSVKKVIDAARAAGADIAGVMVMCNRGGVQSEAVGNPPRFEALLNVHLDSWEEAECALCAHGIPINTEVGHGREFLKKKGTAGV